MFQKQGCYAVARVLERVTGSVLPIQVYASIACEATECVPCLDSFKLTVASDAMLGLLPSAMKTKESKAAPKQLELRLET